jgi:hypothetical protein
MSETVVQQPSGLSGQPAIAPKHAGTSHTESADAHAASMRRWVLIYDITLLSVLIALAILYFRATAVQNLLPTQLRGLPAYTAWFGILGSISVSLKGISDYEPTAQRWGGRWPLWYFARPFTGLIVGIVTYVLLRAAYPSGKPDIPTFEAAAFILGTQERRFFTFLSAIGAIILHTPGDDQPATSTNTTSSKT